MLFDIGGGSSEIALVDVSRSRSNRLANNIVAWTSLPVGVVSLAERFGGRDVGGGTVDRHDRLDAHRLEGRQAFWAFGNRPADHAVAVGDDVVQAVVVGSLRLGGTRHLDPGERLVVLGLLVLGLLAGSRKPAEAQQGGGGDGEGTAQGDAGGHGSEGVSVLGQAIAVPRGRQASSGS